MLNDHICKLCGCKAPLCESHIVPKFVVKYLKESSVTGYLREGINVNVRRQDFSKVKLLCKRCEDLFSNREKQFSELIFRPHLEDKRDLFEYDSWLRYFAVSMFWRFSVMQIEKFDKNNPLLGAAVKEAIEHWTPFLLEQTNNPGDYQYDMFFLDIIERAHPDGRVPGMNWFLMRGVDGTIFSNKKRVGIYWRIPGFLFCCHVKPNKNKHWQGTSIRRKGTFSSLQNIRDKRFGNFLIGRLKGARELQDSMSERQRNKIRESFLKNFGSSHGKVLDIIEADSDYFIRD